MKKYNLLWIISFALLSLSGCYKDAFNAQEVHNASLRESWMSKVTTTPNGWTRHADSWFYNGQPDQIQRFANAEPTPSAMTLMTVKVPQSTTLDIDGSFRVQIVGGQGRNSLYILGPNARARQVGVAFIKNTLYIHQDPNCHDSLGDVIVRVGINNLRKLNYAGDGSLTGRNITSDGLAINSSGDGDILMNGNANLLQVTQTGGGTVTVLGTQSPNVDVSALGPGNVNISGRVGISHLMHHGNGTVNIVGADSNNLIVNAKGEGLTSIVGYVNLKRLTAENGSQVYIYWVNSDGLYVTEHNKANVGLAGAASNLNIDAYDWTRFAGKYLHGGSVYVHTYGNAHATVSANVKIFAAAENDSSIYFYGSPQIVSKYIRQQGAILPIQTALPMP